MASRRPQSHWIWLTWTQTNMTGKIRLAATASWRRLRSPMCSLLSTISYHLTRLYSFSGGISRQRMRSQWTLCDDTLSATNRPSFNSAVDCDAVDDCDWWVWNFINCLSCGLQSWRYNLYAIPKTLFAWFSSQKVEISISQIVFPVLL